MISDRAGARELLHPRGQVRRLADRGVVHVEIAADGANDDLAGVQPDPDLDTAACERRTSSAYGSIASCIRSAA